MQSGQPGGARRQSSRNEKAATRSDRRGQPGRLLSPFGVDGTILARSRVAAVRPFAARLPARSSLPVGRAAPVAPADVPADAFLAKLIVEDGTWHASRAQAEPRCPEPVAMWLKTVSRGPPDATAVLGRREGPEGLGRR